MLKTLWKIPLVKQAIQNKILQQNQNVFNKIVKDYFETGQNIELNTKFISYLKELAYPFKDELHVLWNTKGNADTWRELMENLNYKIKNSVKLKMMIDKQLAFNLKPLNKFLTPPEGMLIDEAFAFKLGKGDYFIFAHHSNDEFVRQIFKNYYHQFRLIAIGLTANQEKKQFKDQIQQLKSQLLESSDKILQVEKNLKKRLHEIDQIFQVSNELFTIHDRDGLIKTSLLTLVGQLGCDRAFILLKNNKDGKFTDFFSKGFGSEQNVFQIEISEALVKFFETGGGILYADEMKFKGETADILPFFKETGARMVAPVIANEELIGIMVCGEKLFGGEYDSIDKRIFQVLSNTINLAFTNLRVYELVAGETFVDKNTGIANKKYFEKRVEEEKSRVLRDNSSLGLLLMQLNNTEEILSEMEANQINRLDRLVVQHLLSVVRTEDFMAFMAPGKYVLLMPGITDETINIAIKRFNEKMKSLTLPDDLQIKDLNLQFEFAIFPEQEEEFENKLMQLLEKREEETEKGEEFFSDLDFSV